MEWWQPLLLHCALVTSNYNQYDLPALCQPFSGAFGLHSGATINLGENSEGVVITNALVLLQILTERSSASLVDTVSPSPVTSPWPADKVKIWR